jgi:ubiquilin
MSEIRIVVKPTAGGDKINLDVSTEDTVMAVKEKLAEKCSMAASEQRLIYKGQILKDERTVESYCEAPCSWASS